MSREKQIEEMAKIFCGMKNGCDGCMWDKVHCIARSFAEESYNAGYRKQSEGEWVMSEWGDDAACSECGCAPYDFKEPLQNPEIAQYCPGCGAKMRGVNYGELKTWDEIRKEREIVG